MIHYVLCDQNFADADSFLKAFHKARTDLGGKKWLGYAGYVAGKELILKTYGYSYPQMMTVDDIRHGGAMDIRKKDFDETLRKAITG